MRNAKLALLALAVIAAATLTGCGRRTMATVNGEKITEHAFQDRLERFPIPGGQGLPPRQAGPS